MIEYEVRHAPCRNSRLAILQQGALLQGGWHILADIFLLVNTWKFTVVTNMTYSHAPK